MNALNAAADVFGSGGGLLGQLFDLAGDNGKTLAGVAGAGRLDRGVQRQKAGLLGNVLDDLDDLADFVGGIA